jgi:hypothetical protein
MHGYKQPLVLEDVDVPDIAADEVLIKSRQLACVARRLNSWMGISRSTTL